NKEVRKSRFKRTFSQKVFRWFLILVLAGEVAYLGFRGFRIVSTSQFFFLNQIEITGTQKTNPDEIRKAILATHRNALLADLTQIKLQLESQPWIQSAVIWRKLPNTIRIHIIERVPVALVLSGNLYMVDASGKVIDVYDQTPDHANLPVLTGINDPANEAQVLAGLEYVGELSRDPQIFSIVSEIHLNGGTDTTVYLKGMSFGLLVSKDGILPMIKKFLAYSELVKKNFNGLKVIDLRYKDQIILKDLYREQL
ncbi:MAG TPA: FtsQ-type POTRA domain-containing protein, partial [Acidobacteriota bacterium]|nr:FtsQ-type POTRA domain-containing protein [Acidobacteriota bacterium]